MPDETETQTVREGAEAWHAANCTVDAGGGCILHLNEKDAWAAGYVASLAEIARLRETIREWQEIYGTFTGDVHAACQTEIARLREELETLEHAHADVMDALELASSDRDRWQRRAELAERVVRRLVELGNDDGSAPDDAWKSAWKDAQGWLDADQAAVREETAG